VGDFARYPIHDPSSYEGQLLDAATKAWFKNRKYESGCDPDYIYLAEPLHDIDPELLPLEGDYIVKIGRASCINRRKRELKYKNLRIFAHAQVPSINHASDIEGAIKKKSYMIREDVATQLEIGHGTECMLLDVHDYKIIADILNHFFDDNPFPRR